MPFESPYASLFERLMANSKVSDRYALKGVPCWEWMGYRIRRGYGRIAIRRPERKSPQGYAAHRVMAEVVLGRSLHPDLETVEHACEIPWCVCYWHFSLVTRADNSADMRARVLGRPRKLFTPLVDPELYFCDPFTRALPVLKADLVGQDCPF